MMIFGLVVCWVQLQEVDVRFLFGAKNLSKYYKAIFHQVFGYCFFKFKLYSLKANLNSSVKVICPSPKSVSGCAAFLSLNLFVKNYYTNHSFTKRQRTYRIARGFDWSPHDGARTQNSCVFSSVITTIRTTTTTNAEINFLTIGCRVVLKCQF